jgi:segregation and condensation protein A
MSDAGEDRVLTRVGEFAVELPVFTGPFRVLTDLLMDGAIDVCDVPVATVTERFVANADQAEVWTLEEATWFLAICAVLLEMKVGRLMPKHREVDEEDLLGASPDLAYARGLELVAFRKLSRWLQGRLVEWAALFPREAGPAEEFADLYPDLMERVTPEVLAEAAAAMLREPVVDLMHVAPIRASVTDALDALTAQLSRKRSKAARFRELVSDCKEPIQVVVRFLALLELYKDGRVGLAQAETFGDIEVSWEA